jgi:hypothetical protein
MLIKHFAAPHSRWARVAAKAWLAACLLTLLAGCYEVAPQNVEAHISIQRDGQFSIKYGGTFKDTSELLAALGDDVTETEEDTLRMLTNSPAIEEVRRTAPHTFFARWLAQGNFNSETLPPLMGGPSGQETKVPNLVGFKRIAVLHKAFEVSDALAPAGFKFDDLAGNPSPEAAAIKRLINNFRGGLSIEIDDDLVLEHNASAKQKISDGRSLYQWALQIPARESVKFSFSLSKEDKDMYKVLKSPPGSDCVRLIGQACKCGPFAVRMQGSGSALVNRPYEITTEAGITRGCTDANGETKSVRVQQTGGRCELKVPPPDEAATQPCARQ